VKTVIYANAKAGTVFMDEKDAVVIKRSAHLTTLGIEGNGVFAKTFIPKGAVFGWYSGLSFSSLPRAAWAKHPLRDNPYNMMVHCLHEEECGRTDHKAAGHDIIVCGDPKVADVTFMSLVNAPRVPGFKTEKGVTKMWLVPDKTRKVVANVDCAFLPGGTST
jgi:hypothetical protein